MIFDGVSNRLKGLRQQGRLIPFVGSGLSKPLGLPDLSALIDFIAEQLDYDPQVFKLNGTELQLAEYYVAIKRSIGPLRSEMDRLFNPSDDQIKKSRAHSALVEMKLPLIYTTNYDRIIERAFDIRKEPYHTIANLDDIVSAPADASTQIVKLHGTFDDDASLVLTEMSYFDRLEFESPIDIKLRADILGKTLLFMDIALAT
jgi:NAD-dependent SIR2 family protein deacetylase